MQSKKFFRRFAWKALFLSGMLSLILSACATSPSANTSSTSSIPSSTPTLVATAITTPSSINSTGVGNSGSQNGGTTGVPQGQGQGCGSGGYITAHALDLGTFSNTTDVPTGAHNQVNSNTADPVTGNMVAFQSGNSAPVATPQHLLLAKDTQGIVYLFNRTDGPLTVILEDTVERDSIEKAANGCPKMQDNPTLPLSLKGHGFWRVGVISNTIQIMGHLFEHPEVKFQIDVPDAPYVYKG